MPCGAKWAGMAGIWRQQIALYFGAAAGQREEMSVPTSYPPEIPPSLILPVSSGDVPDVRNGRQAGVARTCRGDEPADPFVVVLGILPGGPTDAGPST